MATSLSLGKAIYISIKPVIKIFLNMCMGFILTKRKILTVETGRAISTTLLLCLMPCLYFNKIITSLDASDLRIIGILAFGATLNIVVGLIQGIFLILFFPGPKTWHGGMISAAGWSNSGDLPVAYLQSLANASLYTSSEADKGIAYASIYCVVGTITFWNLGGYRLVENDFRDRLNPVDEEDSSDQDSEKVRCNEVPLDFTPILSVKTWVTFINCSWPWKMFSSTVKHKDLHNMNTKVSAVKTGTGNSIADNQAKSSFHLKSTERVESDTNIERTEDQIAVLGQSSSHSFHKITTNNINDSSSSVSSLAYDENTMKIRRIESISKSAGLKRMVSRDVEQDSKSAETTKDLVRVYSEAEIIFNAKQLNLKIERSTSIISDSAIQPISVRPVNSDIDVDDDVFGSNNHKKKRNFVQNIQKSLLFFLANFAKPVGLTVFVALILTMIPWVRALFTNAATAKLPDAPDGNPILSFVMDITSFVGAASVPMGLMQLGSSIARLKLGDFPYKFYGTILLLSIMRLIITPIMFMLLARKLMDIGWIPDTNRLAPFLLVLTAAVPTQNTNMFLTAFYSPPSSHVELDCVAITLLIEYGMLIISLPTIMTFTLKSVLNY